jgi:alpha-methylacyl-CoA racemase
MNRGKKSMTFDLKNKADIEAIKVMIKNHDVLIDPFRPGVLERLGLSYEVC